MTARPRSSSRPADHPPAGRRGDVAALRRPALLPGLVRVDRDAATVQLGTEPPRAVQLLGLTAGHRRVLDLLDGAHDLATVVRAGQRAGLAPGAVTEFVDRLANAGVLHDAADLGRPAEDDLRAADAETADLVAERLRLEPDLAALTLLHRANGPDVIRRRGSAWVEVRGAGRVGSAVATLLAAAGVGRVTVLDARSATPGDTTPAGLAPLDIGGSRALATSARIAVVAPTVATARPLGRADPRLVVLAPDDGPSPALVATWTRRREPHLLAYVRETTGVVGPLVEPGRTACLACLDLHRSDRDPGWPLVAARLGRSTGPAAAEVTLATLVAAQAAMQALGHLAGGPVAVRDATLETSLDAGVTRRRSWSPHPACGCRWAQVAGADPELALAR